MSFFTAKSFVFNGINSEDFDVIIAWLNSDVDVSTNGLNREVVKSQSNKRKTRDNIYGTETTEPIVFTFSLVKINGEEISRPESIRMNQWLTSSSLPQLLIFNDCDSYRLHYYAVCTQINDFVIGGRLVGKELRFETNSPYAFMDKIEKNFDVTDTQTFYLNNTSDTYDGYFYPTITINTNTNDKVVIENVTDKKSVTLDFTNVDADENGNKTVILSSENMILSDRNNDLLYLSAVGWNENYQSYVSSTDSYMTNLYWFRLVNGLNEIKVTGNCNFKSLGVSIRPSL